MQESEALRYMMEGDQKWEMQPRLSVQDPSALKRLIDLINPKANHRTLLTAEIIRLDPKKINIQLGRIFQYSQGYMEKFAQTLQLALTDEEFAYFVDPHAKKAYINMRL